MYIIHSVIKEDFFKEDKYWEKHINKELEEDL